MLIVYIKILLLCYVCGVQSCGAFPVINNAKLETTLKLINRFN